jgi:hypothetical protein
MPLVTIWVIESYPYWQRFPRYAIRRLRSKGYNLINYCAQSEVLFCVKTGSGNPRTTHQGHFKGSLLLPLFKMCGWHCHLYSRRHVGQAVTSPIQWGPLNTFLRLNSYVKRHGFELYLVQKLLRFDEKVLICTNFYWKYNVPGLIIVGDPQQFALVGDPQQLAPVGMRNLFVKKSFESCVCHTEQYMHL